MAKVIFEFNDEEDRIEIENIMKRNDFKYALERIKEYRRFGVRIDFGHESVEML